jgi:chemotaxis response regulator CheB
MDELTREFLIESQEGLDRMEHCLTDLEKRPEDSALIIVVIGVSTGGPAALDVLLSCISFDFSAADFDRATYA